MRKGFLFHLNYLYLSLLIEPMEYPVLIFNCSKCKTKPGARSRMMSYKDYDDDEILVCKLCGRELEISTPLDEGELKELGIETAKELERFSDAHLRQLGIKRNNT